MLLCVILLLLLCKSLTFAASQLACLILGDERNQVTYTASYLPMITLIEWIRNGNKFSSIQCEATIVVCVADGFSVSNSPFGYLYRDKKLASLCAYAYFIFTFKFLFVRFK